MAFLYLGTPQSDDVGLQQDLCDHCAALSITSNHPNLPLLSSLLY